MKKFFLVTTLILMFFVLSLTPLLHFEGMERILMLMNAFCLLLLIFSVFLKKEKKKKIYSKAIITQNAMVISMLSVIYMISGVGGTVYTDWSYMFNSVTLVVAIIMYIDNYRKVIANDKLKEILELKGDSIIKKLYDYYYLSLGVVLVLTSYYLTKITDGNSVYLEMTFILIIMAHIFQISFLKKIIKE